MLKNILKSKHSKKSLFTLRTNSIKRNWHDQPFQQFGQESNIETHSFNLQQVHKQMLEQLNYVNEIRMDLLNNHESASWKDVESTNLRMLTINNQVQILLLHKFFPIVQQRLSYLRYFADGGLVATMHVVNSLRVEHQISTKSAFLESLILDWHRTQALFQMKRELQDFKLYKESVQIATSQIEALNKFIAKRQEEIARLEKELEEDDKQMKKLQAEAVKAGKKRQDVEVPKEVLARLELHKSENRKVAKAKQELEGVSLALTQAKESLEATKKVIDSLKDTPAKTLEESIKTKEKLLDYISQLQAQKEEGLRNFFKIFDQGKEQWTPIAKLSALEYDSYDPIQSVEVDMYELKSLLAYNYQQKGDYDKAISMYQTLLSPQGSEIVTSVGTKSGNPIQRAMVYSNLALCFIQQKKPQLAQIVLTEGITFARQLNLQPHEAVMLKLQETITKKPATQENAKV